MKLLEQQQRHLRLHTKLYRGFMHLFHFQEQEEHKNLGFLQHDLRLKLYYQIGQEEKKKRN